MTTLGLITIGQSPRTDMVPEMAVHWPQISMLECGAFDGWTAEQIAAVPIRAGDELLTSRLADGSSAVFGRELVVPLLQQCVSELEEAGVDAMLIVCTGEFPELNHRRPLLLASTLLTDGVRSLARNVIGVICPLVEQQVGSIAKFAPSQVFTAVADPYSAPPAHFQVEAESLIAKGAQVIVLDCMGYTEQHRKYVSQKTQLPVVLARSIVARFAAEMLVEWSALSESSRHSPIPSY